MQSNGDKSRVGAISRGGRATSQRVQREQCTRKVSMSDRMQPHRPVAPDSAARQQIQVSKAEPYRTRAPSRGWPQEFASVSPRRGIVLPVVAITPWPEEIEFLYSITFRDTRQSFGLLKSRCCRQRVAASKDGDRVPQNLIGAEQDTVRRRSVRLRDVSVDIHISRGCRYAKYRSVHVLRQLNLAAKAAGLIEPKGHIEHVILVI
jgi:hypothetical protein